MANETNKVNYASTPKAVEAPVVEPATTAPSQPAVVVADVLDRDELVIVSAIIGQMVDKHSVSHFISVKNDGTREVRESALRDAWLIAKAVVRTGKEMNRDE